MDNEGLIQSWANWYEAGDASPGTITLRRNHLRRLAAEHDLLNVSEDDLVSFMQGLSHCTSNTRKSLQSSLRSFYRWAQRTGMVDADPTIGLRRVAPAAAVPKPISEVATRRRLPQQMTSSG